MKEMGVSMLEDEESSESIKKLQSQECTISPISSESSRQLPDHENVDSEGQDPILRGTSFEAVKLER